MKSSLRLAGAAALAVSLLLTACAKKTDSTTTASTDTSVTTPAPDAASSPGADASASAAPDTSSSAMAAASTTSASTINGTASGRFITLPVYPGASEAKDQEISSKTDAGSVDLLVYTSSDDSKKVAEWYQAHLPETFKGGILTAGGKTVGTFTDEHDDGDQSVIVAAGANDTGSRIQLTTKHGK